MSWDGEAGAQSGQRAHKQHQLTDREPKSRSGTREAMNEGGNGQKQVEGY